MNRDPVPPEPGRQAEQLLLPPARPADAGEQDIARLNKFALGFFRAQMAPSWVPGYLEDRGIAAATQRQWHIGYAPAGRDTLTCHLRALRFPDTLIEASGLARRSEHGDLTDAFRDRAILPIRLANGTAAGFIGRAAEHARPGVPKYVNSVRTSLYDKGKVLFGLCEALRALAAGAQPVIVEGPFDAIAVTTACRGRFAGLAPCGTALTDRQLTTLSQVVDLRERGVLVAFDSDRAGLRAAVRSYHLLRRFTDKMTVTLLPAGRDPAQILKESGSITLKEVLSNVRPLADLVIDAEVARWSRWLEHPEGQINALRAAAPIIAAMPPDHVGRQVARLAERFKIDHTIVTEAVTEALPGVIAGRAIAPWRREAAPYPTPRTRVEGENSSPDSGPHQSPGAKASKGQLRARRILG
jgi:DNA primase catalytic core